MDEKDCVFCKIVRKEIPKEILYEDENLLGFLDINPKAEGHTLIITKKHFKTLLDMPNTLGPELISLIKKVSLDLMKTKGAEGFNLVLNNYEASGQIVPHVHFHVIPRKKGDGLHGMV